MRGLLEVTVGILQTGQMRVLGNRYLLNRGGGVGIEAMFFPGPEVCTLSENAGGVGSDQDSEPIAFPSLQVSAPTSVHTATTQAPNLAR